MTDLLQVLGVPVLLRGVDLITAIFKDRLGRTNSAQPPALPTADPAELRDRLLHLTVNAVRINQHEAEIEHLVERLALHHANLRHAELQKAQWGDTLVPAVIEHNIRNEQREIERDVQVLLELLKKVTDGDLPAELVAITT
jgi:hypothetical protein